VDDVSIAPLVGAVKVRCLCYGVLGLIGDMNMPTYEISDNASSVLGEIARNDLFQIDRCGDMFEITERLEQWITVILTKEQMLQLALEIIELTKTGDIK
jgi:hypothetical protein